MNPRGRRWIWFFALLAVLGLCAMIIPWAYNLSQQLRPEQLASARALWDQQGPKDYDLEYVIKEDDKPGADPSASPEVESISVRVRQGRIESATRNGKPVSREEENDFGVEALFDLIQGRLENDGQPGQPRSYAHARFDKQDGHPVHYVRRVMGSRQRTEIIIEMASPNAEPVKKPRFPDRN
ncbi:MAG TPA: DUF6174 domain-containing protein [Gemmataceae bacterium]|jgi:hypothetical protein